VLFLVSFLFGIPAVFFHSKNLSCQEHNLINTCFSPYSDAKFGVKSLSSNDITPFSRHSSILQRCFDFLLALPRLSVFAHFDKENKRFQQCRGEEKVCKKKGQQLQ
jgi:hypothetical protein